MNWALKQNVVYRISLLCFVFLSSCSQTPEQYTSTPPPQTIDRTILEGVKLVDSATREVGGLMPNQKRELTEEEKDILKRENSLQPIDYQTGSVANISVETEYKEAVDILNFRGITEDGLSIYNEGIAVRWRDKDPRTPSIIYVWGVYQGAMDFGPHLGESRNRKVGDLFTDQFSVGVSDVTQDPKARDFIVALYKHLEGKEEDCLQNQKCILDINPEGNVVMFILPKMTLLFGNDERRTWVQMAITNDYVSGCFAAPYDLLTSQFFCGVNVDGSPVTVGLGDSYQSALTTSGIDPEMPVSHDNTYLVQRTDSTILGWQRSNFEEKVSKVPPKSPLSLVLMSSTYTQPFLLDQSLIKVTLLDNNQVQLTLDSLDMENQKDKPIQALIAQKQEEIKSNMDSFYLATRLPDATEKTIQERIAENYVLQKNLIKALLNLLEKHYQDFYARKYAKSFSQNIFDEESRTIKEKKFYSLNYNAVKTYQIFNGEYNDKHALKASGSLYVVFNDNSPTLFFEIEIDESSGQATIFSALTTNDFSNYIYTQQTPFDFNESEVTTLSGFTLGEKIYLRDKKIGEGTAITAYLKDKQAITALANYGFEAEADVVYQKGRDQNITYQQSELIALAGLNLFINPTGKNKTINNKIFDEYEINGISASKGAFFEKISNLCAIEGLNVEMGMYDRQFTNTLTKNVAESHKKGITNKNSSSESVEEESQPFSGCSYISPQDNLFSGLKRVYYFPQHKLVLGFADRELASVRIYKKPTGINKAEGGQ